MKKKQFVAVLLALGLMLVSVPIHVMAIDNDHGLPKVPGGELKLRPQWSGSSVNTNTSGGSEDLPVNPEADAVSDGVKSAEADAIAAKAAEDAIAALPDAASLQPGDASAVAAAEDIYSKLTPEQKKLVSNAQKLTDLNNRLAAIPVEQQITALPDISAVTDASEADVSAAEKAFSGLSPQQQSMINNAEKLKNLRNRLTAIPVESQIAALPEPVSLNEKAAVKAARDAYTALAPPVQSYVGNLPKLEAAEVKIQELWEKAPEAVIDEAPKAEEKLSYDGNFHALVSGGKVTGGTIVYCDTRDGVYSSTVPTAKSAGLHVFYYKAQGDDFHKDSAPVKMKIGIAPKSITVTVTIADKQYNGKNDAAIASAVLNGVVAGDTVAVENGTATFESTAVKTAVPVTLTEFKLSGADAGNYALTQPTGVTGNIVNNFTPAEGTEYTLSPKNTTWLAQDLKVTAAAGFTLQKTNGADAPALTELIGSTEGENQTLTFYVRNAEGDISNAVVITYSLDKTAPTITGGENGKAYYDARTIVVEDPSLKTVTLDGSTVTAAAGKAQFTLNQVSTKTEHVIVAEDAAGNKTEIKIIMLPLSSLIDQTAHITESNLKKGDKKTLEAHIQAMQTLKESAALSAEDQALLDAAIARDQALIDRIDSGALEALAEIRFVSAYTKDTVTSEDRTAIQTSLNRMDALLKRGTLPHEEKAQLTAARARAAELLAIIDATAAMIEDCSNTLESYVTDTVKSSNKSSIQNAMKQVDTLLAGNNLTKSERESLEALKVHGQELLRRIKDAYDAVHTEALEKTRHVHKNNVHFGHRDDLETARDQLKHALKTYRNNYLESEIQDIEKNLDRIEAAIRTLDRAATAIWKIDQLPGVLQEGDNRTMAAIESAKQYYDCLTVHEMYLVGMTRYNKLMDLYDSYRHYQVVPMYQEPDSVDVVFQVTGPFKRYVELRIDNAALEKDKDYTVKACKEGTEIVLKDAYLKTLGTRRHEIEVDYKDGIAVGSITNRKVTGSWLPKTADGFHVALWVGTLTVSMGALAVLIYLQKKKMNHF